MSRLLGDTGRTALAHVVEAASKTTVRIWGINGSYDKKDGLRSRFYRWNAGDNGRPRAWYVDVDEETQDEEIAALRAEIFGPG